MTFQTKLREILDAFYGDEYTEAYKEKCVQAILTEVKAIIPNKSNAREGGFLLNPGYSNIEIGAKEDGYNACRQELLRRIDA